MLSLSPALAAYLIFLFTLLGLCIGSFLHAWAWRICHGESVAKGRSHCALCGHLLGARDLIPLFSYLSLRGRCRYCGGPVSRRYPAMEALTAVFFVSILLRCDLLVPLETVRWLGLGSLLLVLSLVDWDTRELPGGLLLAAGALALLRLPLEGLDGLKSAGLGAVSVSVPLLLLVLLSDRLLKKETMGGGDIKLLFVLGLHFGPALTLMTLIVGCLIGIALALATGKGKAADVTIAFGPALSLAAWLVMLWGRPFLAWYLGLFF